MKSDPFLRAGLRTLAPSRQLPFFGQYPGVMSVSMTSWTRCKSWIGRYQRLIQNIGSWCDATRYSRVADAPVGGQRFSEVTQESSEDQVWFYRWPRSSCVWAGERCEHSDSAFAHLNRSQCVARPNKRPKGTRTSTG